MIKYNDLIGLSFEHWGRFGKTKGIDCYGLVLEVSKRIGVKIIEYSKEFADAHDFLSAQKAIYDFRHHYNKVRNPRAGDLVLFNLRCSEGSPKWSLGIMVDNVHFLHTNKEMGVYAARLDDLGHKSVTKGVYRIKDEK